MRALGILGAVAALLAAYLLFFDHDPRDARPSTEETRVVAAFDRAAVHRVTIARAGQPPFSLVRADDGWRIDPGGQPADRAAVEDLLGAVDHAESARGSDLGPAAAGLAPARVTVVLDDGLRGVELRLGNVDASGRGVFAQGGAGAPVRVAPRRLLELADRPPAALRDRRLFPLPVERVARVTWQRGPGQQEHRWDRAASDRWRNAAGARLGTDRVAAVLRLLADLRGESAASDGGVRAPADAWIALGDEAGTVARAGEGDLPAAAREGVWRALESADAPDRRLLSIPPERVRRIALQDGGRRLTLVREGAAQPWRFEEPGAPPEVEQSAVTEWLGRLASTSVVAPASTGRQLIVDGDVDGAVTVGRSDPAFALLDPDPLRFRSRKVLDFAHFDVRELQRTGGGASFDLRSADGETWSGAAADRPIDSAVVARIVGALGNLRADSFLAAAPAAAPSVVLDVAVQPPGSPSPQWHRVQLWDGCVGRADQKAAFRLDPQACNELRLDPAPKR